jgi:hypothetical protein
MNVTFISDEAEGCRTVDAEAHPAAQQTSIAESCTVKS